jgi:hypothetical protein
MSMWRSLLKSAEWKPFMELLSPSFFDVVPAAVLLGQATSLTRNFGDGANFEAARRARAATLAAAGVAVELAPVLPASTQPPVDPQQVGSTLLELYFHQVLKGGSVLLDLRSSTFSTQAGSRLLWTPAPAFVVFEPAFHQGLSQLYRGFYLNNPTQFSQGAQALGLATAQEAIRKQLGDGDQSRVHFTLRGFQQRFHHVFAECKATHAKLHPQFIALGIGLSTLYAHLETLGGTQDVRTAFNRALEGAGNPLD